jgi:hypothetical protein
VLQAALQRTTERLAHELASPGPAAPAWSELQWRVARAATAIHGIAGLLSARLRWEGPPGWESFLCEQRAHTMQRQEQVLQMQQALGARFEEAGIAAVPLKGAALHALGLYAAGERPMADLDILVRERDLEHASQLVRTLGLAPLACTWRERIFAGVSQAPRNALGEHPSRALKIELHTRICEKLPWHITDISRDIFPACAQPGLNAYPSLAALMAHLLLHAAGGMVTRSLRLVHLHDLALLAARMDAAAWARLLVVRTGPTRQEGPWWALPPLRLAARYYPCVLPEPVFHELSSWCHWPLRLACHGQRLTDVSLSRLWIDAFPGLAWSRSTGELLAYLHGRIRPDEATLLERSHVRATADWAGYNPWCRMSQRRRMLSWVLRHPTRPAALHTVLVALGRP